MNNLPTGYQEDPETIDCPSCKGHESDCDWCEGHGDVTLLTADAYFEQV